jgi:hypothetical protein
MLRRSVRHRYDNYGASVLYLASTRQKGLRFGYMNLIRLLINECVVYAVDLVPYAHGFTVSYPMLCKDWTSPMRIDLDEIASATLELNDYDIVCAIRTLS